MVERVTSKRGSRVVMHPCRRESYGWVVGGWGAVLPTWLPLCPLMCDKGPKVSSRGSGGKSVGRRGGGE